jgi:hypothetical protein
MSDADHAPAQSAIYHLARALVRSGAVDPDGLIEAARAVEREGERDDPENERWDEYAHSLRLAAINLPDRHDEPERPQFDVIEGGKAD